MLALSVSLFSGQTLDVQIPSDASLNRLKRLVQSKLQKPVASLARRSGRPLPELGSVAAEGLEDGEELTVVLQQHDRLCSHPDGLCFSAIRRNGTVKFWGNALCEVCGGPPDFPPRTELFHVQKIVAAQNAFAAIRTDGRVVTWGECCAGGETSPAVAEQLVEVQEISATSKAFAAIRSDGSVVTWGFAYLGGNSSAVQLELVDVKEIVGSPFAFAAIRADGAVVTWGTPNRGGDSSAVADQLRKDVISVVASNLAFTALKADGTVVSWGDPLRGGNSQDVQKDLKGVKLIRPCNAAFAALRHDGLVVTWGDPERGGNSSPDMAASVSALEIFADRQPVDFGLTAVVELWLGPNQTLPAKSGDDLTRYAWTSDPSSPQWLSAVQVSEQDRAEKAVYAWRLKVEVKSSDASPVKTAEDNANADMEFYKDEWIPVILPHDQDASTPSPVEIARLFQEVDHIIRGKKIGRDVDLANLEKAAASLGTALCADLARALEADTCEAIQGAIKRGRGADLPKRLVAMKRLCELQLHRALATGDEADLTMALREASRLGGDDAANFKNFAAVKQKLAHLRMKRLQQQSLDVIKGDGKDLDSVMAVINVALRRSDWDRDWDQIWLEVLQEGRAQVKKMIDTAKASGQHEKVAQIFRLADKYGLRVIAAHAVSVWEDTIQAHRQDMKVLLQLCSAANMWGCKSFLSDAQEPLLTQVAELEKKWDKGGAPLARQQFKTLDKEISKLFEKVPTSLKDQIQERHDNAEAREKRLLDEAGKVIQRAESLQGAKPSRTPFKKDKKASELEMEVIQNVMGAMHEAKEWGWKKVMQKGERLLVKQVQTVLEEHELKQASPKLEEMLKAAQQHQVRESFTPILDNCLQVTKEDKKGDECLEAINMAEKLMLSDLRIKAVEEMKIEIEKMKSKEGAEGETQLLGFQDEAQALGDSLAVELATASLAHIEERERKKKEELQQMLQAEERLELIDADPEKTVKCVMVAEESGWKELSKQAIELYKRRVKEAKEMSVAKSNDEAIHGFRFMVRVMHSAQSMRGAVHSRIAVSAKKQVEEMMVKGSALQMFRALAWCTDVEDVHKKVQDLLTKIMKEWEENSEAAPQDVSNLHASVVELSKMSKDLETYSQQMQRLMTADKDMLAAIKDSEDHPTDVAKALEALKVVTARSASNPFQKKVEKMLSRTFEEAKQSGDRKQLELLRDKASKKISEAAAELLKSTDRLPKCLASGDWAGVCALAAEFQSTGCHAFAKDARQHLRDRIDELQTLKAESAALVVYELFTAAKQNGIDELAELLIEKLGASLPAGWATMTADSTSVRKELVTDQEVLDRIQSMVDHTFRTWGSVSVTRDRRGRSMASNLKVEEVLHVDNADNYLRYAAKRQKIRKDLENKALSGTEILPPASSAPASGKSPHIKTHEISLKGLVFHPEEPIDFDLQESWLWHGTRKEGVEGITSSDFDIKRAGSAAGTMFGRGLYFAESCMKSDEYTVADERGWYPLILCRVTCGRFFYCDWKRPFDHTDQLEDACHHKGFHCVLGDREKVSGTYREYIVFDNDQVYPEYIVWYSK